MRRIGAFLLEVQAAEQRWRMGAEGELRLARHLAKLPCPPWHVLHGVAAPEKAASIDLVVIGPPGAFVIAARNHSGKQVSVHEAGLDVGDETDDLAAVRSEAHLLRALLEGSPVQPGVTPVIAVYCRELVIESRPADIAVLDGRHLRRWLTRRPRVLTPADGVAVLQHVAGAVARRRITE